MELEHTWEMFFCIIYEFSFVFGWISGKIDPMSKNLGNVKGPTVCLFLYRLKTPQINIVTRALHFSCTHVTLDKFAYLNKSVLMFMILKLGLVYDTARAHVIQVVKSECKSKYHEIDMN